MNIQFFFLCLCLLSVSTTMNGQTTITKDTISVIKIFQEEETEYIKKWIENLVVETDMDEEATYRFITITSYYGLKMKQLGENRKLTKIEVIDNFNKLVKRQNKELKQILIDSQYTRFSSFYDKLSWSVNKRLNQL